MITAKFGGTAITPQNLQYVKNLVSSGKAVAVSAVGKEHPQDEKTTDLLIKYYSSGSGDVWNKIEDKYRRLAERNCINIDADKILYEAKSRARKYSLAYCMSLGEELSAKFVAQYLGGRYVEAEQCVIFGKCGLNERETLKRLKDAFSGCPLGVIGGFYGGLNNGRTTFTRGGSDVTGALVAVATDSVLYENWTDVCGVCSANPALVNNVKTVSYLSYSQMRLLSLAGAEVLHPDAVLPVEKAAIPIKIDNFFNPDVRCTLVSNCCFQNGLLSVAEKQTGDKFAVTIVHNYSLAKIMQIVEYFVRHNIEFQQICGKKVAVSKVNIHKIEYSRCKVEMTTNASVADSLYKCFELFASKS